MCYQACPYQQQFSLLCPHSSLSAASRLIKLPCLYHSERWLTGLEKVLIFKYVTSFFFWGQSLKHQLCVCDVSRASCVCVCVWVVECVSQSGGLFWFINAFSRQSKGAACATLNFFFFAAILEEMKSKVKRELGGWREWKGRNDGDTITNVFIKTVRGSGEHRGWMAVWAW